MTSVMASGDPPPARCAICGMTAAGPCARCRKLVCADCCELTEGASPFALCTRCVRKGGTALGWQPLLLWLGAIILGLVGFAVLLALLR
ncbi:MAG: hypothetical protein ABI867_11970 [Kofleriaceae bacterium]